MKKIIVFGVIVLALIACSTDTEAITTYSGFDLGQSPPFTGPYTRVPYPKSISAEQTFLSALGGRGVTEDFEGFTAGTLPATIFSEAATLSNPTGYNYNYVNSLSSGTYHGRYPISGSKYLETNHSFTLSFLQPVIAFGFYATDIGDFGGSLSVTINGKIYEIGQTGPLAGGVLY